MISHNIPPEALASHTVLNTALDSLEDPRQREKALRLVRESYNRIALRPSPSDQLIRGAQAKILGKPLSDIKLTDDKAKGADARVFEAFAQAWLAWAAGRDPTAYLSPKTKEGGEYGGAIHLMALEPWGGAIRELHEGSIDEARRLFRRSMELGGQCGTETNDAIQWTYAATFFEDHRGT